MTELERIELERLELFKKIIANQLEIDMEDIQENSKFIEDLEVDSLDIYQLLMRFEEAFRFTIPDSDFRSLETVGDVVRYSIAKTIDRIVKEKMGLGQ